MFFFVTQFLQGDLHFGPLEAGVAFLPTTAVIFAMAQSSRGWRGASATSGCSPRA